LTIIEKCKDSEYLTFTQKASTSWRKVLAGASGRVGAPGCKFSHQVILLANCLRTRWQGVFMYAERYPARGRGPGRDFATNINLSGKTRTSAQPLWHNWLNLCDKAGPAEGDTGATSMTTYIYVNATQFTAT